MRIRTRAALAALLAISGGIGGSVGGCSAGGRGASEARWSGPVSAASATPLSPSRAPSGSGAGSGSGSGDITLEFAGDVHFIDRTGTLLADPTTAFGPIASVLKGADVTMVNLETAVTDRGTPEPKEFHFRAPATAFDAVRAAGVDVVTIANNHALDYGRTGLTDTLDDAHKAGVPAIGAGRNAAEAYAPWVTTVRGTRIAIVAVSQIHELESGWAATDDRSGIAMASDVARSADAVRAARARADVVIVYVHWGQEGNDCPTGEQKAFAARMAEAGATAVVGTHAHLLLGDGMIGKTYVAYGLGNFLWWRDDAYSNDTGVLRLTLHGGAVTKSELVPASISRDTGQPLPVTGGEADRIVKKFADLHACTGLAQAPRG